MQVILLGAPGSGKGTQSTEIVKQFALKHLSTGDMLRAEIANGSELGLVAKEIMEKGELVSDDIILKIVAEQVSNTQKGLLFDGFPRTIAQAEDLDTLLHELKSEITHVIQLKVDNETIIQRLLARGREDDNEETIRNRLSVFNDQTAPLINYYREQNKLSTVLGSGTVENIFARIQTILTS
ncbi:MAG: adenylate kinase [Ostreibacterium sp.]